MPVINSVPIGTKGAYSAYGGCLQFLTCKDHQVFLYGSAGSGKTTVACVKMVMLCLKYPGVKFLFTRKSYRSLIKSGVETFERVCREFGLQIGKGPGKIKRHGETEPREFTFPFAKRTDKDGKVYEGHSRIVLASLDRVYDEMGAEYDYIYVNQPEQITEDDWQFLTTRANGRRGVAPYPQLFGDPNPEHERHWIKMGGYELKDGEKVGDGNRWRLIKSTYRDNPVIWDHKNEKFTSSGEEQIGRLAQSLNTVMAKRLIEGEWCSFEGLVYGDVWDRNRHAMSIEAFSRKYNFDAGDPSWKRYWSIDFGYNDPFVCLFVAKHPERDLYVCYKSIYMSEKTINEHAEVIKANTIGEPRPEAIIADRNPSEIAVLMQALGLNIIQAAKHAGSRKAGINIVADMLKNDEVIFLYDSEVEVDLRLKKLKKPIGFIEEVDNYRWDINKKTTNEEPVDGDDHALDSFRYLATYLKATNRRIPMIWI